MAETTTDHDTIRRWAESKGGKPAAVDRTHQGGDVGIIRLMFPNNPQSEHGSLVEISWEEFFEEFDKRDLALLFDEKSLFSKLVGRDTAEKREHGDHAASRHAGRDEGKHGGSGQHTGAQKSGRNESADQKGGAQSHQGSSKSAGTAKSGGGKAGSDEERSLKEREYRDAEGNVHHHTRTYEEQHGGKGSSR
jgi:hypothetical protein